MKKMLIYTLNIRYNPLLQIIQGNKIYLMQKISKSI